MDNNFISQLKNILFIDIETVSAAASYSEISDSFKKLWDKKHAHRSSDHTPIINPEEWYSQRASLYAEFGKIVSIGVAYFYNNEENELCLRSKAIADTDEASILQQFVTLLSQKRFNPHQTALCAHNGKEFDFPYLCRRMLINQISIPKILYSEQRKPWESPLIDTMEIWRFGDRKVYVSLQLLAELFGIQNENTTMNHTQISDVFYNQPDGLQQIADFSRKDVALTAQVYLYLNGLKPIKGENIFYV